MFLKDIKKSTFLNASWRTWKRLIRKRLQGCVCLFYDRSLILDNCRTQRCYYSVFPKYSCTFVTSRISCQAWNSTESYKAYVYVCCTKQTIASQHNADVVYKVMMEKKSGVYENKSTAIRYQMSGRFNKMCSLPLCCQKCEQSVHNAIHV